MKSSSWQAKSATVDGVKLVSKVASTKLGGRYLRDRTFRETVGLYQGMVFSFVYAVFRAVTGVWYGSVFLVSVAVYDLLLGAMRAGLVYAYRQRNAKGGIAYEHRCYRRTARLLFLLNIPLGGIMILMVRTNPSGGYPGYMIYASASYTFYMMTLSVIHLVKFHKLGSPILSAAKVLNFIAALVSVFGLQNAMITQFSEQNESYRVRMNMLTGVGIYLAVIGTACCMLVCASRRRKGADSV